MVPPPDEVSVLLEPSFLERVGQAALDELTIKRDACRRAAAALAYTARLLRADLEVVEAESEWRSYRFDCQLTRLADTFAATFDGSAATTDEDDQVDEGPLAGLDLLTLSPGLGPDVAAGAAALRLLSDDELARRAGAVRSAAESTSSRRAALRRIVDRLDSEIAARYAAGEADRGHA
jgi:hypothetical protein